jgi:hypothetical protein
MSKPELKLGRGGTAHVRHTVRKRKISCYRLMANTTFFFFANDSSRLVDNPYQ